MIVLAWVHLFVGQAPLEGFSLNLESGNATTKAKGFWSLVILGYKVCESGSLYWANWPKTWFTQFPNHNHWISESFCVRRGVSGFRALCKPPSKLSQLSLLTNLCEWYAVDRKCTDVVIWNTTKTGSVSKRALLTFYVQRFKKFVTREVKQQRFWATHFKRKWADQYASTLPNLYC